MLKIFCYAILILLTFGGSVFASNSCDDQLLGNAVFNTYSTESLRGELKTEITELNRNDVFELALTQDTTHVFASMPKFIPNRAFLFMAKRAFKSKMSELLGMKKRDPRQPEIFSMEIAREEIEYSGRVSTSQMTLRLRARREHLALILQSYLKSLNHPALGNFIIRMDLAAAL